jgi:putative ABC transport system substrate-binding protein
MQRRAFVMLLGGAAAWPLAARAQRRRRIAVFMGASEDDRESRQQADALRQGLQELGWDGSNITVNWYWNVAD